ncbi:hypothetical protein [Maribacter stanieri]|uniref:hypothetical protein n=1 Tax=Maribacter stanieri TaxID=440514 RepID=UPI002494034D|nr:hypothetical protein [Maribacter stanieri]
MKKLFFTLIILCLCLFSQSCNERKTNLVLLGTVHQPVENFNSDSLYNILKKIRPNLILFEVDSSFFTQDFKFKKTWESNENIATVRYMNDFNADVRPYDFTGRNEYRRKIGSRPTDTKTIKLIESLYQKHLLNSEEKSIYQDFLQITDTLNSFGYLGISNFNNEVTDSIARIRQYYQYKKLLEIVDNNKIFSSTFYNKEDGDSISYALGFRRAGEFWDLRNKTMAKHILHFTNEYKGKRIVVLNGYFHRHYLDSLLGPEQKKNNFIIRDLDEY